MIARSKALASFESRLPDFFSLRLSLRLSQRRCSLCSLSSATSSNRARHSAAVLRCNCATSPAFAALGTSGSGELNLSADLHPSQVHHRHGPQTQMSSPSSTHSFCKRRKCRDRRLDLSMRSTRPARALVHRDIPPPPCLRELGRPKLFPRKLWPSCAELVFYWDDNNRFKPKTTVTTLATRRAALYISCCSKAAGSFLVEKLTAGRRENSSCLRGVRPASRAGRCHRSRPDLSARDQN